MCLYLQSNIDSVDNVNKIDDVDSGEDICSQIIQAVVHLQFVLFILKPD